MSKIGHQDILDVSDAIQKMTATKADAIVGFAMDMHEAVRGHAGLEPRWEAASESLKDFYIRLAINNDGRRAEFFGTR